MHPAAHRSTSSLVRARVPVQQEGFGGPEGDGAGVRAHLVVLLSEDVEALVLVDELGHVEVGYLEEQVGAVGGHQDVVGLEVPVDHPVLVEIHHAAQQLAEETLGDGFW